MITATTEAAKRTTKKAGNCISSGNLFVANLNGIINTQQITKIMMIMTFIQVN